MKYLNYQVVFKEVPDEITLSINITNCPYRCPGCHSPYLQEDVGEELTFETLSHLIEKHKGITCVCFMGGNQNTQELLEYLKAIKKKNLKTCLYSGCESLKDIEILLPYLDWVKIGRYNELLLTNDNIQYGIKLATSNQHIYKKGVDY